MASLLAVQQPTGVKTNSHDQALAAKPPANFLKAFGAAKGLIPSRRSESPALPVSRCPALPLPHCPALPCPICVAFVSCSILPALPCLAALPSLALLSLMAVADQSACCDL